MNRPAGQSDFELDRLKELLLRPETDRLAAVETRVGAIDSYVGGKDRLEAATSEILVDAFRRAEIAQHRELANAIAPVVVAAIRSEIKNSKDMMVEALYPITGRLVAAAVANAFRDLVADLNERLDRGLSAQHWKFRFQSLLTGRPVSELALAAAQRPALRRLLLVERGSGRLIAGWGADEDTGDQSELVSGLIAAITEFASSVYGARGGELRTLDLGGSRVFLRGAPLYLAAAECAGALKPEHERELDDAFLSLVSKVDKQPDSARGALADMAERLFATPAEKRKSALPLVLVCAAALALAGWFASGPIARAWKERQIDQAFEQALAAHPELKAWPLGVEVDHSARTVSVVGLDPSDVAARPLVEALTDAASPYAVAERTAAVGGLAEVEALRGKAQALEAQVAALSQSSKDAIDRALAQAVDAAGARTNAAARDVQRDLQKELQAQTQAASERLGALIAGIAPGERARVAVLAAQTAIFFQSGNVSPLDATLAGKRADEIANALRGNDIGLRVIGETDAAGSDRRNAALAQARADAVVAMIAERGVAASRLRAMVRQGGGGLSADARDRRVTFELAYPDEPKP
ncbi:MAG: OmpA family protein [Beijerinckiaceae bacterium]